MQPKVNNFFLFLRKGPFDWQSDACNICCCVGLCLVPGKLQKQRSTNVKNCRLPVFSEDFFDGLGPVSVRKLAFRIKVVNKGSSLKRHTLLGKKELPLTSTTALLVEAPLPSGSCREALMLRLLLGVSWVILFYRGYF
ncbi:hypothetical protein MJT46_005096 [Ovis ammon polii x Ovis aries]|nr:hypothetical protein MJT46_005096 [Ovis ammon polii x Ovis aries]